jgi:glyoxylase-like metal-dependent hydrolase (beta-lactamase superfamily II)
MKLLTAYQNGIYAVDAHYLRPRLAAIHLIKADDRVALVDTGTNESLPRVLAALDELGVSKEQVDYILLTHIHLDHAGGAGLMMQCFPNARLVVHPRGVRHMIDPSRLIEGATAVYGVEEMGRLYGDVLPIDAARIVEASHGLRLDLAGRILHILDTPGHARHHVCIRDELTGCIFTGDAFGLSYPECDVAGRQFVYPATTPVQFDPEEMHASINLLMSFNPGAVYLTHFSQVRDVAGTATELHRLIDAYVDIARQHRDAGMSRHTLIRDGLSALMVREMAAIGSPLPPERILELLQQDIEINAQGLEVWLDSESRPK